MLPEHSSCVCASLRRHSPGVWALLLVPVLVTGLFWKYGCTLQTFGYAAFTVLLVTLSAIDCDQLILPDVLTLPGAALALAASSCLDLPFVESLSGAVLGGAAFWVLAWKFPQNLGLGDAKLMLLLGALCGVRGLPVVVTAGSACGLAFALPTGRKLVPFGPFLSFGAYLHMLGVRV